MKTFRIMIIAAISAVMVSCEIDYDRIDGLNHSDLTYYADILFGNNVILPVEMAEFAIEFDEYLSMPDEEKQDSYRFFGKIRQVGPTLYSFSDDNMSCTIDTKGVSVWQEGAEWEYAEFSVRPQIVGSPGGYRYYSVSDNVIIKFEKDNIGDFQLMASLKSGIDNSFAMALISREDNLYKWNISGSGYDRGEDGLKAEFSAGNGNGGINIGERMSEDNSEKEFICDGIFYVDIYNGADKIDWCQIIFRQGYRVDYLSSR